MAGAIIPEPLDPRSGFNWVFLVEMLISSILTVFFLFYFNRLFATIVSYGIRAYTWRAFHVYIDIQALQISLLGGRLFFKDIRYHGHNETILVHGGHITWQYWHRRVKDADVYSKHPLSDDRNTSEASSTQGTRPSSRWRNVDSAEKGGKQIQKRLPCRIKIKVSGVEAFMYNRTPAYDGIIDGIRRKAEADSNEGRKSSGAEESVAAGNGSVTSSAHIHDDGHHHSKLRKAPDQEECDVTRVQTDKTVAPKTRPDPLPAFLRLLPIHIDCNKGAIVVGNEHTESVITAQFEKASGEIDASKSGPLDVYQQVFKFDFTHPVVHMKPNPDFKTSQLEMAARLKQEAVEGNPDQDMDEKSGKPKKTPSRWTSRLPSLPHLFSKSTDSIHTHHRPTPGKRKRSYASQMNVPGQERWKGLTRYLDESQTTGHGEWDDVEYAKTSLIADCEAVNVSFYWDVTGPVPSELENSVYADPKYSQDVNGSMPPEYGMDIQVHGGTINYGPWADRHRAVFQSIFFPGSHVDAVPVKPLATGDLRVLSIFKLYLSIEKDTVLRIPVREPSKDWKWKGKSQALAEREKHAADKTKVKPKSRRRTKQRDNTASGFNGRPFGWIDVKIASNSSVNYTMDMVASETGYHNKVDADIAGTEISSSVNHGLLWRSGPMGLDCDLSNPLSWNSVRKWGFNVSCQDLELFLLRDHLFLLTDLVADWGSGPPSDYYTFVPFQYLLNMDFTNFKLYLNTNDSNIVNNPSDLDDNNFIVLNGQRLHGEVIIPLDRYRPLQNEIRFDVRGQDLGLEIRMPSKNTLNTFVQCKKVADLGALVLTGSHTIMTETSQMNTDRLFMDIQGSRFSLELYGWLVHHFMKVKDNYFGDDMHFKTLEEFQGLPSQSVATDPTIPNGQPAKVSNDLDVILCVSAEDVSVIIPSNLYSAESSLRADVPYASADLRFTNYYMDLMVDFSPISLSLGTSVAKPGLPTATSGRTEIFIQSVAIFGHRLFGLPPSEPTYVCNWDFDVGKVSGECTPDFVEKAVGVARSFAFTFDDPENALPMTDPLVIHDATFLRLKTQDIRVWFHVASEAILVSAGPISLEFNDLAGTMFSQRLNAWIPDFTVGFADAKSASRYRTATVEQHTIKTHAFLQTTLTVNMLKRKLNFTEERDKQQAHMQEHDQRTNRTQFMFIDYPSSSQGRGTHQNSLQPPAMQFPDIPHPIFLFPPRDTDGGSTISSGYYSEPQSAMGRHRRSAAFRTASTASLTHSIRQGRQGRPRGDIAEPRQGRTRLDNHHTGITPPERGLLSPPEDGIQKPNQPPTSVALSSSLATPYFPLDRAQLNLSDVPSIPTTLTNLGDEGDNDIIFNDVSSNHLDEAFEHTSLIINSEPGIRLHCTPEAIRCLSDLVALVLPKRPEDLLDGFHVKVMSQILDNQKRREGKGTSLEFNVRIPFVHVRFQNVYGPGDGADSGQDQYDIILNQLKVAARMKNFPADQASEDISSLHTRLGSLGVTITERSLQGSNDDVAVQGEIKDLLIWMLKGKETSVNINFKTFEAATKSRKINYLASLIHRTALLGNELVTRFEEVQEKHRLRLRYLAWYLTKGQERFPDPAFLTKASYALRAAKDHLRNHDSWKIISRFRYMWRCLPEDEKTKVLGPCSDDSVDCPEGIEDKVITMWDRWRTWDLAHVNKSLAMKTLFGTASPEDTLPSAIPLYMDIRSRSVKLVVDPGLSQSETSLVALAVNFAIIPPPKPTGLMLVEADLPKKAMILQLSTKETAIRLRWEICELIETLITMFQKDEVEWSAHRPPLTSSVPQKKREDQDFQVVYVSEKALFSLDTINLQGDATGQRFRLSLAASDRQGSGEGMTSTVLLHLEQAVMQLGSRTRPLLRSEFTQPSLYFAHHAYQGNTAIPDKIKVAGASRMIKLQVQEDILGFIAVVDLVVRDEIAYFYRQAASFKKSVKHVPEHDMEPKATQLPNITLALFMDAYLIDLKLLQSLSWTITGSSGRVSAVPTLGQNVTLRVDYDLAAHTHKMTTDSPDGRHVISSLDLPPVNGRLTVTNAETETQISASGIIETIQLQASEVQAVFATFNKPEFPGVIRDIQEDVDMLKLHIREVFPKPAGSPVVKKPKSSRTIVFDVGMTLSGLVVLASAPGQQKKTATANLAVRMASVQLKATNIGPNKTRLGFAEVIAHLGEIKVEMTMSDSETIRRCGNLTFGATFHATTRKDSHGDRRVYRLRSSGLKVDIFADTASAVVDVMNHLQDKIRDLDLSKERKYLRRLRHTRSRTPQKRDKSETNSDLESVSSGALFRSTYSLELLKIRVSWIVGTSITPYPRTETEDLVLSFRRISLTTRKGDSARLMIEDMQLQMVPVSADKDIRSRNSALLPEIVFNVTYGSTEDTRNIAFQAAGNSLDLRLDSRFVLPASVIEQSIALAGKKFRAASANWSMTPTTTGAQRTNPFGKKRLASLLVGAKFAGAVVHINGNDIAPNPGKKESRSQQKGRYSQFVGDESQSSMILKAPGIALKVEHKDDGQEPFLNGELMIEASSNTLFPTVVPILINISDAIKEVVRQKDERSPVTTVASDTPPKPAAKLLEEDNFITADPSTILGRTRLNLGLRVCKQEFSLSCQPIARVAAIAKLEDMYLTVSSVKSQEHGHFFAASAAFQKLEATVQHVYSNESTFGFDVESIVLSLMNSKHLSGTSGISAILKINPMGLQINARQLQDFLLFREIWLPPEIRRASKRPAANVTQGPQEYLIQRYEQVTAATAFPWNANISIADVAVDLDLGQAIGKTSLHIHNMWASSKKSTDWEQNMCIGVEQIGLESTGRTSGFVELHGVRVRTSIRWPSQSLGVRQTPLVQASLGFSQLRVKAGFDYQAFMIADIANFNFLMYNVREQLEGGSDRLVASLEGDKVHVCCTATSAAQGLALLQAIERLVQDNQQAYKQSLKDIERFLRRKSLVSAPYGRSASQSTILTRPDEDGFKTPISLHTDVVVMLRSINLGVFPSTFVDAQIFSIEAEDVQARFAVALEQGKIHSALGMTLGKLSVALASIPAPKKAKPAGDLTVEEVLESAKSARGGIILRVPKVIATMHTWQLPKGENIDYIFQSNLEGKVDVGWNYSRISYIRTMWSNHSRTLASRLGKPLPESNIKITSSQTQNPPAMPSSSSKDADAENNEQDEKELAGPSSASTGTQQEKITAEIKVPQSRYTYTPLEPPVIETPQLRDMGEATPPLEWIGLHRDRLPNVTHQIVIVTLLEVAREVEEAYTRILGSS